MNPGSDTVRLSALVALAVAGSAAASTTGPQIKRPIGVQAHLKAAAPAASSAAPAGVPAAVWSLKGNRRTNPATDFLGTTDAVDMIFRTNNVERLRILSSGEVRILSDLTIDRDLRVGRDGSFGRNVSIGGDLGVAGLGRFSNATDSTSPGTGALVVTGGAGIGKGLNVGGDGSFAKNLGVTGDLSLSGIGRFNNTADATSSTTGSAIVAGGVGIGKRLYVDGDSFLNKNVTVGTDGLIKGKAGVGDIRSNTRFNVTTDPALTYAFAVAAGTTPRFAIEPNGRVYVDSTATGDGTNTSHYALQVRAPRQGVVIRLDTEKADVDNRFISFWSRNKVSGRIEGQTLEDYGTDPEQLLINAVRVANAAALVVAIAAAIVEPADVISLGADTVLDVFQAAEETLNVGVTYQSGAGDYAEYLRRATPNEKIPTASIVGVRGGRISKNLAGAQQLLVISHAPIVLGNVPDAGEEALFEKCAFLGQVRVRITGVAREGDYIVPSGLNDGTGIAVSPEMMTADEFSRVVGRVWETSAGSTPRTVKIAVGLNAGDVASVVNKHQAELSQLKQQSDESRAEVELLKVQLRSLRRSVDKIIATSPKPTTVARAAAPRRK